MNAAAVAEIQTSVDGRFFRLLIMLRLQGVLPQKPTDFSSGRRKQ